MRRLAILLYGILALGANATSYVYRPDEPVENDRACSRNDRFCLVRRDYPGLGDFATVLRKDLPPRDVERNTSTAALYRIDGEQRTLLSTFEVPRFGKNLVADSGKFVAAFPEHGDTLLMIFAADGTLIRTLKDSDVFTPSDVLSIGLDRLDVVESIAFDEELDREVISVGLPAKIHGDFESYETVRIDPVTGALVDPKRDIYPPARVLVTSSEGVGTMSRQCGLDPDAVRIASKQLLARAKERVVPVYPEVAQKARVSGDVFAEVVVSEDGRVVETCIQGLPFGITERAEEAVRQWTFEPYEIGGRAVRVTSEIVFHFKRVEHALLRVTSIH